MRRQGWRAFGRASVLAMALAGPAMACDAPDGAAGLRDGMIEWINGARRDEGLPALRPARALQKAAEGHACDMAERNFFAHDAPGGPSFTGRLKAAGYTYRAANENIAYTPQPSVAVASKMWQGSSEHWANILDPGMRSIGLGIAQGNGRTYWVMNTGRE